jgi:hypothetical protein
MLVKNYACLLADEQQGPETKVKKEIFQKLTLSPTNKHHFSTQQECLHRRGLWYFG